MKKILLISMLLCALIGKAQSNSFVAVITEKRDTLYLLMSEQVSYKIAEIWYIRKDRPVIIYVSYDRLFREYIKQNWATKPKEIVSVLDYGTNN